MHRRWRRAVIQGTCFKIIFETSNEKIDTCILRLVNASDAHAQSFICSCDVALCLKFHLSSYGMYANLHMLCTRTVKALANLTCTSSHESFCSRMPGFTVSCPLAHLHFIVTFSVNDEKELKLGLILSVRQK